MNLFDIMTIIFIIFKLLGYLDWSWYKVFMPSVIFYAGITIIYTICLIIKGGEND